MRTLIVGSGVGGALLASRLCQAGHDVVLVEAGPAVDRAQAWARFRSSLDPSRVYPHQAGQQPRWGDEEAFYVQAGPEPFGGLYERLVGGTTWHWLGTAMRFLESDFELRRRYRVGCDWPLGLAELEPYYRQAEEELGVAGSHALPPLAMSYLDRAVAQAAQHHGYRVEVLPAARNSRPYRGRPACEGNASCFPICPIGAKYDASVHVAQALAGGAQLLANTRALRLCERRGRITALEVVGPRGEHHEIAADHFVLSANAIETPRLLQFSGLDSYPTGRFLMGMVGQVSWALAPRPVWPFRSPQVISGLTQFRDGPWRSQRAAFLTSIGNDGWPGHSPPELALKLIEEGWSGTALVKRLNDHCSRQVLLVSNCEEPGLPSNRVELSQRLDALGVPAPRLHFKVADYARAAIDEAVLVHARIFDAMRAEQIHHVEESTDPAHLAGTCRMGNDPRQAVVDRDLRHHRYRNLSILGSAVFPSVGSAPPTLTIAALALRLAHSLAKTRSS